MRLLILVIVAVAMLGCGKTVEPTPEKPPLDKSLTEKSLVGQWNIISKMPPAEIERITKIKGAFNTTGHVIFKEDKTLEFLFNVNTAGDTFGSTLNGTYKYENDVLSITDSKTGKTKRSKLKFEDDLLVMTPIDSDVDPNFLIYLKRVP